MGVQPAEPARPAVEEIVGTKGDATVLDYVINVLEDEDFEFGPEGREAYDAFGEMLVLPLPDAHICPVFALVCLLCATDWRTRDLQTSPRCISARSCVTDQPCTHRVAAAQVALR